jgi:hypothetical protein
MGGLNIGLYMSELETCPGCSERFDARAALVSWGVPAFFNMYTSSGVSMLVRCPNCRRQFRSRKVIFFGFLTPSGVGWTVLVLLLICIAVVVGQRA